MSRPGGGLERWGAVALLAAVTLPPLDARADGTWCRWQDIEVEARAVAPSTGATLERPNLSLRLGEGTFYPLRACDRRVGLIWLGDGEVEVGSPGPQRAPLLHLSSPDLPGTVLLDAVFLVASDGAVDELLAQSEGLRDEPTPPGVFAMAQQRSAALDPTRPTGWTPPGEVLAAPLPELGGALVDLRTEAVRWNQPGNPLERPTPWLSWLWAPSGPLGAPGEPGLLLRRAVGTVEHRILAAFPAPETLSDARSPFALGDTGGWRVLEAALSVRAEGPLGAERTLEDLGVTSVLALSGGIGRPPFVPLQLAEGYARRLDEQWSDLEVLGVTVPADTPEGWAPAPWLRSGDRLWVEVAPGPSATLRVQTEGRLLETQGRTAIRPLSSSEDWYPRSWSFAPHQVTTVVAMPRFWDVAATGHRIGEEDDGRRRTVTSRSAGPVPGAALVFGDMRSEVVRPAGPGVPLVRVHRNPELPAPNARIGSELEEWLPRLAALLGPYRGTELELLERGPATWGDPDEPGVITLPAFDSPPNRLVTTRAGRDSLLEAITRQWLTAGRPRPDYHELWLLEGLVTWASCLVLEEGGQGARCHGRLAGLRRQWVDGMTPGGLGAASPDALEMLAGAVWHDASAPSGPSNRWMRGPLVWHSLRLLVGDDVVRRSLRLLMETDEVLTLERALVAVQDTAGADLRAFVYGWVLNTPPLPVAHLEYRLVEDGDGWALEGTGWVDDGRGTDRKLPLPTPILLGFRQGKELAVQRLLFSEQPARFRIGGLAERPRSVELDPGNTFPGRVEARRVD